MDVNRAILLEQCRKQNPFEIPEIIAYILKYIPNENLGPHLLKINLIWQAEILWDLKVRYRNAKNAYNIAVKEYKKVKKVRDQGEEDFWEALESEEYRKAFHWAEYECKKAEDTYKEAKDKKYTAFAEQVAIEKVLLRCEIITQELDWEKWTQMNYNIRLLDEECTPDDSDNEEEE